MAESQPGMLESFNTLFIAPFASHQWSSRVGRSHWVELEGWQDSMAGPLSAIAKRGGCEYVYPLDDWYFAPVSDPASLRARLRERHSGLAAEVDRFVPATAGETTDLEFMRSVVTRMLELIEQACAIEQVRWESTRQAEQGAEAAGGS